MTDDTNVRRLKELLAEMGKPFIVAWAYPTSTTAAKLGFYKTGCWFVSALVDGDITKPRRIISKGVADKRLAQEIADTLTRGRAEISTG